MNADRTTWRDRVIYKLRSRPREVTIEQIAESLGMSSRWVSDVANGRIANPGINSMEALETYLDEVSKAQ